MAWPDFPYDEYYDFETTPLPNWIETDSNGILDPHSSIDKYYGLYSCRFDFNNSFAANITRDLGSEKPQLSMGFWFKTPDSTYNYIDNRVFMYWMDGSSNVPVMFLYDNNIGSGIRSVQFWVGGAFSSKITVSPDTWYWINIWYEADAPTDYLRVYDTAGTLVGEVSLSGTYYWVQTIVIQKQPIVYASGACEVFYDDIVLDWTNARYPMLGEEEPPPPPTVTYNFSKSSRTLIVPKPHHNRYKPSRAEIIKATSNQFIRIVEYSNPEVIIPKLMNEYFLEVGYSSIYPFFKDLRIGAVHPFAILLFQEVSGQNLDVSMFPSITISDTSDSEVYSEISRGYTEMMIGGTETAIIAAGKDSGQLIISDSNMQKLIDATVDDQKVFAKKVDYRASHNVDLNIWSENKDLTSLIYDLVKLFVMANIGRLHENGLDVQAPIGGRRSGDINVEFGKILYGANVTVPLVIDTATMWIDLPTGDIEHIVPVPDYHIAENRR